MPARPSAWRVLGALTLILMLTFSTAAAVAGAAERSKDARVAQREIRRAEARAERASRLAVCVMAARAATTRVTACPASAKLASTRVRRPPRKPAPTPTPTPAPAPTPVPPAPTPTPTTIPSPAPTDPGASRFGFAAGGAIQSEDATTLGRDLDAMTAVKSGWIRIDLNWAQIQAGGPSAYDWAAIDRVVLAARGRGLQVLADILYTPSWARPAGSAATYGPAPAQYAAFAQAAVRHYAALGVHTYEVWNEANTPAFWTPSPNVAAYAALLKAAYPAIKDADPQATVLTAGTAPAPSDGTSISPVDFLKGLYANGAKGSFDAVAHHPYCWPAYPGDAQGWSAWYQMFGASTSLRTVMTANGDGAKKIWATEFGAPTNGPSGSYVTESQQAEMLQRGFTLWRSYDWAGPMLWYAGRDLGTAADTRENFFGVMRNDFTKKPAFAAYQAIAGAS